MADGINRRNFGRTAIAGVLGGTLYLRANGAQADKSPAPAEQEKGGVAAEPTAKKSHGSVQEAAHPVPVVDECDVVVCGAGPAGVAAALSAARSGAKTRLIEVHGCLGGIWTAGLLTWILDASNKPGLMSEILARLDAEGAKNKMGYGIASDPEIMKWVLEEMCEEAGVEVRLLTRVTGAVVDDNKRLTHVLTQSKSGEEAWKAKVFIDTTGDGDLAALAGCQFKVGSEESGATQPLSLIALVSGIDAKEVTPYINHIGPNAKHALRGAMKKGGHDPSYASTSLFDFYGDLFCLMSNHEYQVQADDAQAITNATINARAELQSQMKALRSLGGPWKNLQLVATAEQIGVREGRRIRGLYEINTEDLRNGTKFPDGVCTVSFGIDVHATDPKKSKSNDKVSFKARAYQIPLRSLIAADVDGLMMAGRCISGDFIAHSSYRVTGNAVAMGEAVGSTAAIAALTNVSPKDVPWAEAEKAITKQRFRPT